jgi:hypothetical protein
MVSMTPAAVCDRHDSAGSAVAIQFQHLGVPISFEDPIHEYDAVAVTAEKCFRNGWACVAVCRPRD